MSHEKQINMFGLAFGLEQQLRAEGIRFNEFGYPDFRNVSFPTEIPPACEVLPLKKRHRARNRRRTILCPFEGDPSLCGRLHDLKGLTAETARDYYGVCGFDLSVCADMPIAEQKTFMLLNMLITGYMITRGVRVIPNWRIGDLSTAVALRSYPRHICFAAGTLGCARRDIAHGTAETIHKIMLSQPSSLLVYGPLRREYAAVLDDWNIPYLVKNDFRRDSYDGKYRIGKAA